MEDDTCLQTVLTRLLQGISQDIDIHWAGSAEHALKEIEASEKDKSGESAFDLVVADIFLPGTTTGLDLWRICQQKHRNIPFLLTSGMPVDQFLNSLPKDVNCPPYLPKPFFPGECKQVIEGLLGYAHHHRRHAA